MQKRFFFDWLKSFFLIFEESFFLMQKKVFFDGFPDLGCADGSGVRTG